MVESGDCGRLILVSGGLGVVSMLMGEFRHNIDAKRSLDRAFKTARRIRRTIRVDSWIRWLSFGYPISEWNELESKLNDMPPSKERR